MNFLPLPLYRDILNAADWRTDESPLPPAVSQWLRHTDSLTEKLLKICPNVQVEITQQGWQAVSSEPNFANFCPKPTACEPVWLREVVIYGNGTPWIFAQTRLPQHTVNAVAQEVLNLGDQPIGLWLFPQHPRRLSLEWRQDPQTGLYARRSTLLLNGYPLTIAELFLPEFSFAPLAQKA